MGDPSLEMQALEDSAAPTSEASAGNENFTRDAHEKSITPGSSAVNGVVVKGGWDELPHNMGSLASKPIEPTPGEKTDEKPLKAAKKRAPAKSKAKKAAPAEPSELTKEDQDVANGTETGAAIVAADMPAKPAPKKRAYRKKAEVKEAQEKDVEMADVMQDAAEPVETKPKPAPKKRAPRKKATPKSIPADGEHVAETGAKADGGSSGDIKAETEAAAVMKPATEKKSIEMPANEEAEDVAQQNEDVDNVDTVAAPKLAPITPAKTPRKRATPKKKAAKDEVKTEGDVDADGTGATTALAPKTPKPRASRKKAVQQPSPAESNADGDDAAVKTETPKITITRKRTKKEDGEESDFEEQKPKRKRAAKAKKVDTGVDVVGEVNKLIEGAEVDSKVKKPKAARYGITPGISPYPDWPLPTAEACYEVNKLLSDVHGVVEQPKAIPPPSLEITGCGEVPSVLDALIRTRLSAATTGTNSGYAFAGLVEKFGIMETGIGKGSINWNKVREADVKDIENAIRRGGLAQSKSKSIKAILEKVHEQNLERREAFKKEKEEGAKAEVVGAETLPQGVKDLEIAAADEDVLTLQYMHALTDNEAMTELTKFNGIGVKTASCVILFCLRRPSFAVDTHVFRLCKWLKWIPEKATRDKTFSHCEVRIPNELKYSLHQLFIRHGKTCGRCRAATGMSSEAWENANCPLEHLLTRTGERKMFKSTPKTPKKKGKKAKKGKEEEDEETESELSEHEDDEFEDLLSGESDELPPSPENDDEVNASEAETEILDENMEDAAEDETEEEQ